MTKKNPKVDEFIRKAGKWQAEFEKLRSILLDTPLTEDFKWRGPCYTFEGGNVAVIQGMKEYCALMFFKGTLMKDPKRMLVAPGAAQAVRQVRFTDVRQIAARQSDLKAYVREAIALEKSGVKVRLKKTSEFTMPEEFRRKLGEMPALRRAFEALTPGRQRAYLFYFADAKQASTRAARVAKCIPAILKGEGLRDR